MAQTVLAFDFGTQNIGVAVGQSITGTASELPPLKAKDGIPNWNAIGSLLSEWEPRLVVVGLPLNMDDSESDLGARARKFARRIQGRFGIAIELMDERLSTFAAKGEAASRGHRGSYANNPVDSIAARLILESWFNQQINPTPQST